MDQPLVSVVIPNHNCEDFLWEATISVLNQSYTNLEIIIVDDGSTDNSLQVIDKLTEYDKRVKSHKQENKGIGFTRNKGVELTSGEYIAFLDSDDVWHPEKIKMQVNILESNKQYGGCFTSFVMWNDDLNGQYPPAAEIFKEHTIMPEVSLDPQLSGWIYHLLLENVNVWTSAFIVRKEVLENVGVFNTNLRKGQDYDLWLRIADQYQLAKLDCVTALYRQHSASITQSIQEINYAGMIIEGAIKTLGVKSKNGARLTDQQLNIRLMKVWRHHALQCFYGKKFAVARRSFKKSLSYKMTFSTFIYYICANPLFYQLIMLIKRN